MKRYIILSAVLLTLSLPARAADLQRSLTRFFSDRLQGIADTVSVTIRTPDARRPTCPQPQLTLAGNSRLWGTLSVQARCDGVTHYLQVQVMATGDYVVTRTPLARGTVIDAANLTRQRGRLDLLPSRALLSDDRLSGAITLRDIAAGQPILPFMVRARWAVTAGQRVQVIASGAGFSVNSEGLALNNAAVAGNVRVRMNSGQVVSGRVGDGGNILINMPAL
ncbi:flagellar basal body P-ring formation chaperone FlgA [Entomohabitans teleogrylli]|uniref:flagellar basal body P-ring formation chaperone FlgA n=1 Tax=Entomohabitans teleogrylli TaxID=1384589 RepID=UPI00073D720F|nr:flagellar basal body P-ring formation chaperone FlgA [Entomohabitans teleogrylli]